MAASIADDLRCSICLDLFTEPKILLCCHTFCKACLEPLVERDHRGKLSLSCPNCRKRYLLRGGVYNIPDNLALNNILATVRPQLESPKPPILCCSKHTDEEVRFYCHKCKIGICRECAITAHHKHTITQLVKYVDDSLKYVLRDLRTKEHMLESHIKTLEDQLSIGEGQAVINNACDSIIANVEQHRRHLLHDLTSKVTAKRKLVEPVIASSNRQLEDVSAGVQFITGVLDVNSDHELITRGFPKLPELRDLEDSPLPLIPQAHVFVSDCNKRHTHIARGLPKLISLSPNELSISLKSNNCVLVKLDRRIITAIPSSAVTASLYTSNMTILCHVVRRPNNTWEVSFNRLKRRHIYLMRVFFLGEFCKEFSFST